MNEFIETLKIRHQDALKRFQVAQQKLAVAQAEAQGAQQEYNSWNYALATETTKAQQEQEAAGGPPAPAPAAASIATGSMANEVNKTDLVRGVLRQHPAGITPTEIWKELKDQVGNAYIYSVLKRLKDREEVAKKRGGKYYLKHPQPEEVAAQNGVVQR